MLYATSRICRLKRLLSHLRHLVILFPRHLNERINVWLGLLASEHGPGVVEPPQILLRFECPDVQIQSQHLIVR